MTDTLTDFVMKGKLDFSSLAESILRDITNMVVKTQITLPLMNMLGMGTTAAGSSQSGNLLSGVDHSADDQRDWICNQCDRQLGKWTVYQY